jgi:hypothetical protein
MPAAPVTPAEMRTLVVRESDTVCDAFVKILKMSVAVWKLCKFKYTITGALTANYRTLMCAAECPAVDQPGSTTSSNPPT